MTGTLAGPALVSVVVPAYNIGRYVRAAIETALAQTYRPLEVIVVDDGSEDETAAVCSSFGDRICYLRQKNGGAASVRNTGVRRARGRFIAFLDGDDLWEPETIAVQVEAAERFPGSGLIAVDGVEFDDDTGAIVADTLLTSVGKALLVRAASTVWHGYCYADLLAGTPISTASQILVPKWVFQAVGQWDPRFSVSHDYELYLRIAARFPLTLLARKLVRWRRRTTGLSGPSSQRFFNWRKDTCAILRRQLALAAPTDRPAILASLHRTAREIAQAAYYRGESGSRLWATRYLLRLAFTSHQFALVAPYVIALFCPAAIRSLMKRALPTVARGRHRGGI